MYNFCASLLAILLFGAEPQREHRTQSNLGYLSYFIEIRTPKVSKAMF